MSLKDLSPNDFSWLREKNRKMKDCHEKEFLNQADPKIMRALYRGMRKSAEDIKQFQEQASKRDNMVTLNRIFTSTNTILPNVYNQNPRKMAIPRNNTSEVSAALMTSSLNYYTKKTRQKEENQEAIMNAWFFGLGWKKVGYHIATESDVPGPESKLTMMDKAALGVKSVLGVLPTPTQAKETPDVVRYETLTNSSESPMNVLIDDKGDLRSYKYITHCLPRTLHDLMEFGEYEDEVLNEIMEKYTYQNGTRFDMRDIDLTFNEMMIQNRNGIWLLAFCEEYSKPLRYEKLTHEGEMPWSPLALTNEPGVRYPVAHMKVASKVQEWIDNVVNLQIDILGKARNQHYVNKKILNPGQDKAFQQNKIGGIVFGNRPASAGDIMEIASRGVSSDSFNILALFQQNLTEITGANEQRISGVSKNRTLGQDKIAELGNQIREGGLLDKTRDWMIDQARKEGQFLKQYSNAQLNLKITPKDFTDPETGRRIEETWVEFKTPRQPLPLRFYLEGEFDYDVNVYEAVKSDNPEIRKQLFEALNVLAPLQDVFVQEGGRVRLLELAQAIAGTFDAVDIGQFIEKLDSRQQAALQAMQVLQKSGGVVPPELGGGTMEQEQVPQEVAQ